jgi:hypothetical protein
MRRPVEVKSILFSFRETRFVLPPSGCCRHASIRTLEERFVSLGACWSSSIQPVLPSVWRPVVLLSESGARARRLTQSPELGFGHLSYLFWNGFGVVCLFILRGCGYWCWAAVAQRFVHFSAHPQMMQQHRQLSRRRHDGSLLAVPSATLSQLQAATSQITVHTERS